MTLVTGISSPSTTAAMARPSGPNTARTTGMKTNPFQRMMPWKTLE